MFCDYALVQLHVCQQPGPDQDVPFLVISNTVGSVEHNQWCQMPPLALCRKHVLLMRIIIMHDN